MFTPRGSAILWTSPKYHDVIRPLATSAYVGNEGSYTDFIWEGTVDYTPFFCSEAAIKFINSIGGQVVVYICVLVFYCGYNIKSNLIDLFICLRLRIVYDLEFDNLTVQT